jgi:hypothetical protein
MLGMEPDSRKLAAELGTAKAAWDGIVAAVAASHGPVEQEWRPSKSAFGSMCLLRRKKKTLLYLTPGKGEVVVAVVLGERAVGLALAADLPEEIKALIREARPYVEGRGIRFPARTMADVPVVTMLVAIKTTPK